jgi:hypothetical protein
MEMLVYIIPTWAVSMIGYVIYKKKVNRKGSFNNDVSNRVRKIKLKNQRYINTKSIFK